MIKCEYNPWSPCRFNSGWTVDDSIAHLYDEATHHCTLEDIRLELAPHGWFKCCNYELVE